MSVNWSSHRMSGTTRERLGIVYKVRLFGLKIYMRFYVLLNIRSLIKLHEEYMSFVQKLENVGKYKSLKHHYSREHC